MSAGPAGWEQGIQGERKGTLNRAARSDGSARARMAANAGCMDDPGEPLVCPRCRTHYDTGLYCVDCDVELVGESFVDSAAPTRRKRESGWIFVAFVVVALGFLASLALLGAVDIL